MALEAAAELPQRHQLLFREVAALGQDGVEDGDGMAFAQNKPVAVGPQGRRRVVTEYAEVESAEDFDGREGAAGMATARGGEHGNDVAPCPLGYSLNILNGRRGRSTIKLRL